MPRPKAPRPLRITLRDVASEAGVAVPTASLALSGAPNTRIAAETIDRIRAVAARLGYTPHFATRLLQGKETGIVALCIAGPRLARDETVRDMVQAVGERLMRDGRKMYLLPFGEHSLRDLETLMERGARAFIFAGDPPDRALLLERLEAEGIPWVGYASSLDRNVRADVRSGVEALVREALARGRRRIAAVLPDPTKPTIPCERWAGLLAGLGREPELICTPPENSHEEGTIAGAAARATREFLSAARRPDAIFYHTDLAAAGGIHAILAAGLVPGRDLLVCGVNDSNLARFGAYPFPSVRFDPPALADALVDHLPRKDTFHVRVPVTPVFRGGEAPPYSA